MNRTQHVIKCAMNVVESYTFKMSDVLDQVDRCIPYPNSLHLKQLNRALASLVDPAMEADMIVLIREMVWRVDTHVELVDLADKGREILEEYDEEHGVA